MNIKTVIHSLAVIAVAVGLLLGPLAYPGLEHSSKAQAQSTVSGESVAKADQMDCCPKRQPMSHCRDCPLMALCSTVFTQQALIAIVAPRFARRDRKRGPGDEPALIGLKSPPPAEPPRSAV